MTYIDFSRTLDKTVVHRAAIAEVLPTSAARAEDETILIGVQLPRYHGFYGDVLRSHGGYDTLLFVESIRQSIYVVAHMFSGVPLNRSFTLRSISMTLTDPSLINYGNAPVEAILRVRVAEEFRDKSGTLAGFRLACRLMVDGSEAAVGEASASWLTPADMTAMRVRGRERCALPAVPVPCPAPTRIASEMVNRRVPLNVVISDVQRDAAGSCRSVVVVDTTHPTLFDHPLDHLPGMLEIEACRQTAIASAVHGGLLSRSWRMDAVTAQFYRYAEHDLPVLVEVSFPEVIDQSDGSNRVLCDARVTQDEHHLAAVQVSLTCEAVSVRRGLPVLATLP